MGKFKFLVLLLTTLLVLPIAALALEDDPVMGGGNVDPEISGGIACDNPQCQEVINLEDEYAAQRLELLQEIENETDPWQRETIQREIQKLKCLEELALNELHLKIAISEGDVERATELQKVVDSLYEPKSAATVLSEPRQDPEDDSLEPVAPIKNPDDA